MFMRPVTKLVQSGTLRVPKMSSAEVRAHAAGDQLPGAVVLVVQLRTAAWEVFTAA
jgi:hypothetical protein